MFELYRQRISVVAASEASQNPVAITIPWSLLLLLLAMAGFYAYTASLEQRRRRERQAVVDRYKTSQTARSVFLDVTSRYISTPIAVMQGRLQMLEKAGMLEEDTLVAANSQIEKLSKHAQAVLSQAQQLPTEQLETIRKSEDLSKPGGLATPIVWVPTLILLTLALVTNFIFIRADVYNASLINTLSQALTGLLALGVLLVSYYYLRKSRLNRNLLDQQLKLERHYALQQAQFIQNAYLTLSEDITALSVVCDSFLNRPEASDFRDSLVKLSNSIKELEKLKTLTERDPDKILRTDLEKVAKQALAAVHDAAGRAQVGVISNIEPYLMVNMSPDSLFHLMECTLDNAIRFSSIGAQVHFSASAADDAVVILVEDRGKGISPALKNHLLTPFTRDSGKKFTYEGMGLDLYLSRLILDHHQGKIVITSKPGKGTKVEMTIPASPRLD